MAMIVLRGPAPEWRDGSMKISRLRVSGWECAIRGMRFPLNSDNKYDTKIDWCEDMGEVPELGPRDLSLLMRLCGAGRDHRKVLRMLHVQTAVAMPMSWWCQMDTYKVGTTANSRSRMHRFGSALLDRSDFYVEDWDGAMESILTEINRLITKFKTGAEDEAKAAWRKALDILPMSYVQERMLDLNYEVIAGMFHSRWNEKLGREWKFFLSTMLNACPYLNGVVEAVASQRSLTTEEFNAKA